jgi:hypothetical protein
MLDKMQRLYEAWLLCGGEWPMSKRIETQNAIHAEYSWDIIVRDQFAPLMTRLANEAPRLGGPAQFEGVSVPQDEMSSFLAAVNEGIAQDKPQKRIAPLMPKTIIDPPREIVLDANGYSPVADEVTQ